jgi:hypothetical protein
MYGFYGNKDDDDDDRLYSYLINISMIQEVQWIV